MQLGRHASAVIGRLGGRVLRSRAVMRLPIRLYQARLGFLFGHRLLMLEHIGRHSGARRYVVLEVVDHPASGTYVVASGFGRQAQWFRNILVEPHVRVSSGRGKPAAATARVLAAAEADATLDAYRERHRRAWNIFRPVIENTLGSTITAHDSRLPMVELRLSAWKSGSRSPSRGFG